MCGRGTEGAWPSRRGLVGWASRPRCEAGQPQATDSRRFHVYTVPSNPERKPYLVQFHRSPQAPNPAPHPSRPCQARAARREARRGRCRRTAGRPPCQARRLPRRAPVTPPRTRKTAGHPQNRPAPVTLPGARNTAGHPPPRRGHRRGLAGRGQLRQRRGRHDNGGHVQRRARPRRIARPAFAACVRAGTDICTDIGTDTRTRRRPVEKSSG